MPLFIPKKDFNSLCHLGIIFSFIPLPPCLLFLLQLCLHYDKLDNCTKKSQEGCKECEKGFYLERTRCEECHENCTACSSATECSECVEDYIHEDKSATKCIHYEDVSHCISPSNDGTFTCASCKNGYRLSSDKYSCEIIPPNYALLIANCALRIAN